MKYILCLGDSLTYGARDRYGRSYPAELSKIFWERDKKEIYCVNRGISGETSSDLLRRIYSDVNSCSEVDLVLLLIGSNDTFLQQKPEIYKDNIRQIVSVILNKKDRLIIGSIPPFKGFGLPNYPNNANKLVSQYNEKLYEIGEEFEISILNTSYLEKYIIDTVHFSHEGYCYMAKMWYNVIKSNRWGL